MGMSSLLGILDGLGSILSSVFGGIFTWVAKTFLVPLIKGAITAIVLVIKFCFSAVFLSISQFLLKLIDFVEILFRALAGLPSDTGGMSITMTLDGKDGDLLISMLTSHEVIQAFYATAIVGMFLLIITTIFQMIKVEYTTEGAQNSKTTILGKSLKSLCNMLIVPLLCILGVFIGNQVLDLIDTATGGGKENKISGQLWITAATDAMIKPGSLITSLEDFKVKLESNDDILSVAITVGMTIGIESSIIEMFGGEAKEYALGNKDVDPTTRDTIENKFAQCAKGYSYYNGLDIAKYYNIFEVNYLVLIFGACIIIKCLFYTCFGLIDRLYQCVALFIVMPMVIGMSPVKDSMGSWRSKFMSKALSAYGTVISLNLFFIIVRVMLNIDIKFTDTEMLGDGFLSSYLMEGLIKSIMVIVGCLMIEKLAGDLGGYFGGGNAMAEGKGLAKDATAGITKAAKFAGGVAMGGASLAMKGVSTARGIADKISEKKEHKADKATATQKESAFKDSNKRLNDAMSNAGVDDATLTTYSDIANDVSNNMIIRDRAEHNISFAQNAKDKAQKVLDDKSSTMEDRAAARQQIADADKTIKENTKIKDDASKEIATGTHMISEMQRDHKGIGTAYSALRETRSAKQDYDSASAKVKANEEAVQERKEHNKEVRQAKWTATKEGVRQLAQDKFGAKAMFNTFAPKSLQNLSKDYQSAQKTAMDASPEGQAMMAMLDKQKKDEAEAGFNKRNAGAIETRNLYQAELILKTTNEKMAVTNAETNKELQTLNSKLEELINKKGNAADDATKSMYANQISAIQQSMQAKNSKISFGDDLKVENKEELKVDFKMDANFMKKIQDEIKKGVKMDDIMEQINEEFKKIGLTDKDTLAKIYKALEELKSNFGGK